MKNCGVHACCKWSGQQLPAGHLPWMSTDRHCRLNSPQPLSLPSSCLRVVATVLALPQTLQPRTPCLISLTSATGFRLCLPSEMSLDPTLLSFLGDTHLELSLSLAQRPTDPARGLLLCSPPHCCSARSLSFPEAWVPGQVLARSGTSQVRYRPGQVPARSRPCLCTHTCGWALLWFPPSPGSVIALLSPPTTVQSPERWAVTAFSAFPEPHSCLCCSS